MSNLSIPYSGDSLALGRLGRRALTAREEAPKRISATQLMQSPSQAPMQALVESKTELSLSGDCLDLLVAPGDVLLMRGSGRISDIGNAGGFMGHVLVVTATPVAVRHGTPEAEQLSAVWPKEAKALWKVGTVESTRREQGLYECAGGPGCLGCMSYNGPN